MTVNEQLIPLIPALPIFGFAFTALLGRRIGRFAFLLPLLLVVASWAIAMGVVYTQLTGGYGEAGANVKLWEWIPAGLVPHRHRLPRGQPDGVPPRSSSRRSACSSTSTAWGTCPTTGPGGASSPT